MSSVNLTNTRKRVVEQKPLSTSEVLEKVVRKREADMLTIEELTISLHERGFGLLMVFFSFPFAVPLPYPPGVTLFAGIPMALLSLQLLCGRDTPWMPDWIGKRAIRRATMANMIEKSAPMLRWLERFLHPRMPMMCTKTAERFVGLTAFIYSISIAIPIPFTNAIPSAGILLMSLGLLGRDGLMILIGIIVGAIGVLIAITALVLFALGVTHLLPA